MSERYQCIRIRSHVSSKTRFLRGVPERPMLGSLLFIVYIAPLVTILENTILTFIISIIIIVIIIAVIIINSSIIIIIIIITVNFIIIIITMKRYGKLGLTNQI